MFGRNVLFRVGLGAALLALVACSANSGGSTSASESGSASASSKRKKPVITLNISPTSLSEGQSAIVTWSSSNDTSCKAAGSWSGAAALGDASGLTIGPFTSPGTYTYGIVCTGPGGTTAANRTVIVGAPADPTIEFDIVPSSVTPGSSAVITWTSTNATTCTGSSGTGADGWQGNQPTQDPDGFNTGPIAKAGQYEYDLTCLGPGGSTQATRILTVTAAAPPPAPSLVFSAQSTLVDPGDSTTFSWSATNATACAASGGSGTDGWSGTEPLTSTATSVGPIGAGSYSYTLTCSGPGGSTAKSVSIVSSTSPPAVALNIAVTPTQITAGSAANLTWSSANADTCTASGSWSGSEPLQGNSVSTGTLTTAGVYSFTLTCSGVDGSTMDSATLTVAPAPATIVSFSAAPSSIQTGQSTALSWTSSGASACTGSGAGAIGGWNGAQATANTNLAVGPFTSAGVYLFTLSCTGPGGTGTPRTVTVTVANSTPPAVSVTQFAATPASIQTGQSSSLTWSTSGATACTASGGTGSDGWSGNVATASAGTSTGAITAAGSYVYTLTCSGPGGTSAPSSVIVNVSATPPPAASVSSFTVTPATIQVGQAAPLAWSTNGATACTASGGTGSDNWPGSVSTSSNGTSTGTIATAGTYTYTLTCSGPGGMGAPSSVSLDVTNAPSSAASVGSFSASPSTVQVGQSTTLTWSTANATACTASGGSGSDGWGGSVATNASVTVGPIAAAGTYTYSLACTGPAGSAGPASVIVTASSAPPAPATINSFTATPSTIQTGAAASLAWSTSGATTCTASGGTGGWSGSVATSSTGTSTGPINTANSYTYTLTCSGAGGSSAPSSVVVNVNNAPPPAASITSFTASPSVLQTGQSTTLAWSSNSATGCTASGGSGSDAWSGALSASGSQSVGPLSTAGNFVYTLTCSGPGGSSGSESVTVDVNSSPPAATIGAFSASPATIQTGQSATLAWSSSGATSCAATGGTGSDNWNGSVATSSAGTSIGPINANGPVTYTLTCTGAGGSSAPSSATVNVTATPPAATIAGFTATSPLQTGQAPTLAWSSSNATSCTASGGTGSDGWSGSEPTSSSGTTLTPINTAGTYVYTLTCSGPGGTGSPSSATVTVSNAPPAAVINSFSATPSTLQTGQTVQLAWSTSAASACSATGGTGSDGWSGTVPVSSNGTTVGPINAAGTYAYTLTCTGSGGTSSPSTIDVTVNNAPAAPTIVSFTATPSTIQAGQAASLAWSTGNATSCTATGGTGSDGWNGTVASSSSGTSTGPLNAGTVTYTLACTGPGGTSPSNSVTVTVNPATPAQPTVTLQVNGSSSAQIQPGSAPTLSWSTTGASSCVASGGTGADGWSGSQAVTNSGVTLSAITTPGIYSYTLNCTGAGGSGSNTVQLTVVSSASYDCQIPGLTTASLVAPAASVTTHITGALCLLDCSVAHAGNVIDSTPSNYATLIIPLGLTGGVALDVAAGTTYPAGRQIGFIMANGNTLLDTALLGGVTIETRLNGAVQETTSGGNLLSLQAAGLLAVDPYAGFVGFTTTKPFDSIDVVADSLATLASTVRVYSACVTQ